MNLAGFFKREVIAPSVEDSARQLSEWRCLNERERRKARARLMCEQMGRPIPEALR